MVESYMIFIDSGLGSIYSVVLSNIIVFSFVIVCLNEEIEKKELYNKSQLEIKERVNILVFNLCEGVNFFKGMMIIIEIQILLLIEICLVLFVKLVNVDNES